MKESAPFQPSWKQKITFNVDFHAHKNRAFYIRSTLNVILLLAFSIEIVMRNNSSRGQGNILALTSRVVTINSSYCLLQFSFSAFFIGGSPYRFSLSSHTPMR